MARQGLAVAQAPGQHGVDDQPGPIVKGQEQELAAAERAREVAPGQGLGHVAAEQATHHERAARLGRRDLHAG